MNHVNIRVDSIVAEAIRAGRRLMAACPQSLTRGLGRTKCMASKNEGPIDPPSILESETRITAAHDKTRSRQDHV